MLSGQYLKVSSPYVVDTKENKQNIYKLFKVDTYA